jgi:type II secretion system protein N
VSRFVRIASITLGVIVGIIAIALTALNLYVQSLGTQATIEQELSQRLGAPVRVRAVSVTPWGGLTLSGITIPQTDGSTAGDFLAARRFQLQVGILSMFSRQLVIKKVSLIAPTVIWPQNEEGKWRLPEAERKEPRPTKHGAILPAASPAGDNVVTPTIDPTVAPLTTSVPLPADAPLPSQRPAGLLPDVRKASVKGGSFRFLDQAGNMIAVFQDVDFRASVRNLNTLRGTVAIAKMSVRDRFFLDGMRSPLRYDPQGLELPKISAHAGNGEVTGGFSMNPETEDSPFKVNIRFRNVDVDQLVTDAGGARGVIQGRVEGNLEAAGKTSDPNALAGAGEIFLRDGQLQQYSMLVALGQVLQIEELTQLHLDQAHAKYRVSPGFITIDELVLRSPNLRLTATGTVAFNGKLKLDSQLAINEKIRGQLFKPIRQNFQPGSEPGFSAVDFQVSGTLDRPKTNLVERVVGQDLKDMVSDFFGGKKPDRAKKKKRADALASPAEETASPPPAAIEPVPSPTPAATSP